MASRWCRRPVQSGRGAAENGVSAAGRALGCDQRAHPYDHDRKKAAGRLQAALSVGDAIGSWEWDVVNDRVTADQQFAVIYNVDPARAAAGTPVSEFLHCIHPDDLPLVQSQIDTAVRYGDHYQAEYRIVDRMGEIHWISGQGSPGRHWQLRPFPRSMLRYNDKQEDRGRARGLGQQSAMIRQAGQFGFSTTGPID